MPLTPAAQDEHPSVPVVPLARSEAAELRGLSAAEVAQRQARGEVNQAAPSASRSYKRIIRDHALTPINTLLYVIAAVLIALGLFGDALMTGGLVLLNVVVGAAQESRAKHKLDRIALLTRPKATVIRDGREQSIDPAEVVRGDLLVLHLGSQVIVDGSVVRSNALTIDESLLTGESDPIPKGVGDTVVSGSFCVAGSGVYRADRIGAESMAEQITRDARTYRLIRTPLQREIGLVLRAIAVLALALAIQTGLAYYRTLHDLPLVQSVQAAAVLVSLVPQGLSLMTTVTYALAALNVSGKGALVQRTSAIESCSRVDILCLDKTGTLTSNRLQLQELRPLAPELTEAEVASMLGTFAASVADGNKTIEAIRQAYPAAAQPVLEEVPFASVRKWSALALDGAAPGIYLLGAPEMLQPALAAPLDEPVEREWRDRGWRTLLFLYHPPGGSLFVAGRPQLPAGARPLCLIAFTDELRPEAQQTLERFRAVGVRPKIISGDHPETVAALARQAGFAGDVKSMSGLEIDRWDDSQLELLAEEVDVFGRVTPGQKERLVRLLRGRDHSVAMIGDGVNDVSALKQSDLAVVMESGSEVTRAIADVVLLGDSFAALPAAFREGQRILRGMADIICLFLARTLSLALVVLVVAFLGKDFPVTPKHNALLALLTVGLPTLAMATWSRPGLTPRHLVTAASGFIAPAAVTIATVSVTMYLFYLATLHDMLVARSALTSTSVLCGIILILFVEPPSPAWVGGHELRGERRQVYLAGAMFALYLVALFWPPVRDFFELRPLPGSGYVILALVVIGWGATLRFIWRMQPDRRLLALLRRRRAAG